MSRKEAGGGSGERLGGSEGGGRESLCRGRSGSICRGGERESVECVEVAEGGGGGAERGWRGARGEKGRVYVTVGEGQEGRGCVSGGRIATACWHN